MRGPVCRELTGRRSGWGQDGFMIKMSRTRGSIVRRRLKPTRPRKMLVSGVVTGSMVKMSPSGRSQSGDGEHDAVDVQWPHCWNTPRWCTY